MTRSLRHHLALIGREDPPEPRDAFVTALELRLTELMSSSATADVMPEIEMAPPPPVPRPARFRVATAGVACALIAAALGFASSIDEGVPSTIALPASAPGAADLGVAAGERASSDTAPASAPAGSAPGRPTRGTVGLGATTTAVPADGAAASQPAPLDGLAEGTPARVFLSWQRYEGDDFAAYLVVRSTVDEVDHPDATGRSHLLLRIENRDMVTHQDTPQLGTTPRYRVVAVDRDGNVIARTAVLLPWRPLEHSSRGVALFSE